MYIPLKIEILSYNDIAKKAKQFLRKYNPHETVPIPIEEIVEFDMGLDIIPTPNLLRDFDVDGFTSSDLTCMYVDDFIYTMRPARYRFTLAHELGHVVLHKDIFLSHSFDSIVEWKEFQINSDPDQYDWMEWQAYSFGGLVLVPPNQLNKYFMDNLPSIKPKIKLMQKKKIPRGSYLEYVLEAIAKDLGRIFDVSSDVVKKRITKDKLTKHIP